LNARPYIKAGEYVCPVMGRCIAPKPQGPFTLKGGAGGVSFKNVFASEMEFTFTLDNPAFTVNKTEKIPAKGVKQIAVNYKAAGLGGCCPPRQSLPFRTLVPRFKCHPMTWHAISAWPIAYHVIHLNCTSNPRLLSFTAHYDVASNLRQALSSIALCTLVS